MKMLFLVLLLMSFSLRAQAPVSAQAVPVRQEPRHHLVFENEYVRAFYVEIAPLDSSLLHEHALDYTYVTLGASDIINAPLGKPEITVHLNDGEVRYARGGFSHVAKNLSDKPFRNVTIEFLRPQGTLRNICQKVVEGLLGACPDTSPLRGIAKMSYEARPLFETDETLVLSGTLAAKATHAENAPETGPFLLAWTIPL